MNRCLVNFQWSPTGKARGTSIKYPPTPLGAEALWCASAKASEGYPPSAKSAEAAILQLMINPGTVLRIHPRAKPVVFCVGG